ncbi:alkaline phosphatase D family protein [Oligoflexus tunisiensis]|uniref:alkaline phosphatase D family protein n=1 Tax=Oligoflexus tunisiensis TaxID=708132 RepID=UPI000AE01696|nr:alkaline phosphatase D family protein [Oligoflexus tunisiensis]
MEWKGTNPPQMPWGVQLGDISPRSVTIWSATDRPATMLVDIADNPGFRQAQTFEGAVALAAQDFTARLALERLPPAELLHYRVRFRDLENPQLISEPTTGVFRPLPARPQRLRFCFSGDTAGQGWGINPEFGGMRIYQAMLQRQPDFFIHLGDTIYADMPLPLTVPLDDGRIWTNLVTEAKTKVAETLQEFRGNYQYNLLDQHLRRFHATVPILAQWDDHEVLDNWYPQEILDDARYTEKSVARLASRSRQAFFEYNPIHPEAMARQQIYRSFAFGDLLEIFMLDLRSYRGPNSPNRQTLRSPATEVMGSAQRDWLKTSLACSKAMWKIISSDMPLGLLVRDGSTDFETIANGDGPPLGRELEIADLLAFILQNDIRNVVWITADVHYAAAHYYNPQKAQFKNFKPFWEFVSGPLHAGTFGPNALDNTFGPELRWKGIPDGMKPNRSPAEGLQFFGEMEASMETLQIRQFDLHGNAVFAMELPAESWL